MADTSDLLKCSIAAGSPAMQRKIKCLMSEYAQAIYAEAKVTVGHALRVAYSAKVLDGSASVNEMAQVVVMQNAVTSKIIAGEIPTDAELRAATRGAFNAFAGVETGA